MFGKTFYHSTLRKTVIAFGSLFDNLYVTRPKDNSTVKIKVPIMYSGKEKFMQRYKDELQHSDKSITVSTVLPRLGFEISSLEYDSVRKKPSVNKRILQSEPVDPEDPEYKTLFTEVPYNVTIDLFSFVRYMDDGLQIAEQILPFFTPDFTVAIKQTVTNEENEKMSIPFILNSVTVDNSYEGDFAESTTRMIIWNYNFTARINLFGPLSNIGVIKDTNINLYTSLQELEEE